MNAERMNRLDRTAHSLRNFDEHPFISHEREELVEKLLSSGDPKLRDIGLLEAEFLKMRRASCNRK